MDKDLQNFISGQKLLVLSTVDKDQPWISNFYFSTDDNLNIYLVTGPETNHSKQIETNSKVAFSIPWFDENNLGNRKAVQGKGEMLRIVDDEEIKAALEVHLKKYPAWKGCYQF